MTFCAEPFSVNSKFVPEKTAAPTRSTANVSHKALTQQASISISTESKAAGGLGAGMAAAAELEETRASSSPASLSRARFSPLKGNQSPSVCVHTLNWSQKIY